MQHKLKIHWMHCVSCEILLEKNLSKIIWIKVVSVNHKNWDLIIDISDNSKIKEIENEIKKMNYSFVWNNNKWNSLQDYIEIFWVFLVLWFFIYLLYDLDITSKIPIITWNVSVLIAFLIWIVASVSTCLALLWWIVISLWTTMTEIEKEKTFFEKARPHIYFNFWRIIWFTVLWWLLWFIWTKFIVSPSFNWILTVIIAVMMFYIWLHILNFVPSITKLWIHLPKYFTKNINNLSEKKHSLMPAIIWALTFFLPCWFTQSMQITSIASWSVITWALIMWAFALWTAPVLFAIWFWSSYAQKNKFGLFKKLIWVLIIFFAIYSFWNWMKLQGIDLNKWTSNINNQVNNINETTNNLVEQDNSEVETINISHNWRFLEPYSINLKAWKKYKIIITPENNWQWCMFSMFIPNVDEEPKYIKQWENIEYNINWLNKWTYDIICTAMAMQHWELIVE